MSNAIVQINFNFTQTKEELEAGSAAAADHFAALQGMCWKVWLIDEDRREAGGIYLFESRELADAYAASDTVAGIRASQANFQIKVFDLMEAPSMVTRAPVGMLAGA